MKLFFLGILVFHFSVFGEGTTSKLFSPAIAYEPDIFSQKNQQSFSLNEDQSSISDAGLETVLRSRTARINWHVFSEWGQSNDSVDGVLSSEVPGFGAPRLQEKSTHFQDNKEENGDVFSLNLFEDLTYQARVEERGSLFSGPGEWISGSLEDQEEGSMVFLKRGNFVAGYIFSVLGAYQIQTQPNVAPGTVEIMEVDFPSSDLVGDAIFPPGAGSYFPEEDDTPHLESFFFQKNMQGPEDEEVPALDSEEGYGDVNKIIDLAVFYTTDLKKEYEKLYGADYDYITALEFRIEGDVIIVNKAFKNSGVNIQLRLVHLGEAKYNAQGKDSKETLKKFAGRSDGYMDQVHDVRKKKGADVMYLATNGIKTCGYAYILDFANTANREYAFSVGRLNCGPHILAHEIGHNLGLTHDRFSVTRSLHVSNPCGYGYVNQKAFKDSGKYPWRTIMSYNDQCVKNDMYCPLILRFSNALQKLEGDPLGVSGDCREIGKESSSRYTYKNGPASASEVLHKNGKKTSHFYPSVNQKPSFFSGEKIDPQKYFVHSFSSSLFPSAWGGDAPLVYSVSPALPEGLYFSSIFQAIHGIPGKPQALTHYTYSVTDKDGDTDTLSFSIEIMDRPQFLERITNKVYTVGEAIPPLILPQARGGEGRLVYSLRPALPEGLVLISKGGINKIIGTPLRLSKKTLYTYNVIDKNHSKAGLRFTIQVKVPENINSVLEQPYFFSWLYR